MAYKFNPVTNLWDKVPDVVVKSASGSSTSGSNTSPLTTAVPVLATVPTTTAKKDASVNTANASTKEYIEVDYNMLSGDATVRPSLKYTSRKTINMQGLGKYLSGLYYADVVTTDFGISGVTQTISVIKNGFGDTDKSREFTPLVQLVDDSGNVLTVFNNPDVLKGLTPNTATVAVGTSVATTSKNVTPTVAKRTYTMKSGDSLWSIAVTYYKNGALWTKIATANNISVAQSTKLLVGRVLIIP